MSTDPNNTSTASNPVGRFMVAAGAVIELNDTGKILLVQRSPTLDWHPSEWEITYGRIDQFEDVPTGLRREVFEELGIREITIHEVLRVWHIFRGSPKAENELIGITYHCRTSQEDVKVSAEHSQYRWVPAEEAAKLVSIDGIREDVNAFLKLQ